jgi:hypothetical protein
MFEYLHLRRKVFVMFADFLTNVPQVLSPRGQAGVHKAILMVAHRILIIAFCMLLDGTVYQEFGGAYFDKLNPVRTRNRLIRASRNWRPRDPAASPWISYLSRSCRRDHRCVGEFG